MPTALPMHNIRRYYTESCNKITSPAIITDGFILSVMFPRETFFWRARIRLYYRQCFRRWVVFLFATELATKMGFTDDCYTDGRVPSVSPSVLFSPTDFIVVTDGMSPSVKLDNVVVNE